MKGILPYLLLLLALVLFVTYLYRNASRYEQLLDFSLGSLLLLVGLALTTIVGLGGVNYLFVRALYVPLDLNEAIGLSAITTLANLLPFSGGIVAKSVYLKQRYNLSYTDFVSGTVALYVLFVATDGFLGLLMLAWAAIRVQAMPSLILLTGFFAMAGSGLLFLLPLELSILPRKWNRRFSNLMNGWQLLKRHRAVLTGLIAVHVGVTVINAGRLWVAFHALSQDVSFSQSLIFSAASILTQLVTITPGGLGVREGIVAAVASFHGIAPDISILAVALDRLVATTIVIGVGAFYSYILGRQALMPASVEHLGEEVPATYLEESGSSPESIGDQTTKEYSTSSRDELSCK